MPLQITTSMIRARSSAPPALRTRPFGKRSARPPAANPVSYTHLVQMGGIAFARVNAQPLSDFYKPLMVFSLPFIFRDADHQWKVLDGKVGDEVLDGMKAARMVGLAYYDSGSRNIYNSQRAVKSPADLKGLKIRGLLYTSCWAASPTCTRRRAAP